RDYTNAGRTDIGYGPGRWPRKRAICTTNPKNSSRLATNLRQDTDNGLICLILPPSRGLRRSTPRPMMLRLAAIADGLGPHRETCDSAAQERIQRRCRQMHAKHADGPVRLTHRGPR